MCTIKQVFELLLGVVGFSNSSIQSILTNEDIYVWITYYALLSCVFILIQTWVFIVDAKLQVDIF